MAKMDGNWLLTVAALGVISVQPQACQSLDNPAINDSVVVTDYLDAVATDVMQPEIATTLESVEVLIEAIRTLEPSTIKMENAQNAFADTMLQWQRMEVLQIGPWASSLTSDVGEDLRNDIYSWPLVNPCRIDQETASQTYLEEDFVDTALVSMRGLDTIGYLLSASTESICPSQVPPISDGSWEALGEDAIFQHRIEYALVLAEDVQARLLGAQDQWADGFPHDLYTSQSAALNDVFNAMLYVEEMVKDRKLAHPMGLQDCTTDCHLDIESGDSVAYLVANLESFERLFTLGDETGGMIAVMEELGEQDIALSIVSQTRLSVEALNIIDAPLSNVIQDSPEQVETAIEMLSEVTTPLKWDVAAVLRLEIPESAAGDND